jgi:hypothetical protein
MTTLRVLLTAAPDDRRAERWALYDDAGRRIEHGTGVAAEWPPAERCEAVLAADLVRVASLELPPLPAARVAQAARYALEDRLATPVEQDVVAVGPRDSAGRVVAIVVAREIGEALVRSARFDRALAEPQIAEASSAWRWCQSDISAFVRTDDGAAFTVSPVADPALPPELLLALSHAARTGRAPEQVIAQRDADPALVSAWERASGVPFAAGAPWQWDAQPPERFARAIDVLAAARAALAPAERRARFGVSTALSIAIAALVLHLGAMLATWLYGAWDLARAQRALEAIAREAGATQAASLARLHGVARHRAGLHAPRDALPLLARAAPALAGLPVGSLKSATFAADAWTLELAPLDDAELRTLDARLAQAGLSALHAKTASGARARIAALR